MERISHVVSASYVQARVLEIRFSDGSIKHVDFAPYIARGGVFEPLSSLGYFKKFFVDVNTVCWPNGADVAPERLFEIGVLIKAAA